MAKKKEKIDTVSIIERYKKAKKRAHNVDEEVTYRRGWFCDNNHKWCCHYKDLVEWCEMLEARAPCKEELERQAEELERQRAEIERAEYRLSAAFGCDVGIYEVGGK